MKQMIKAGPSIKGSKVVVLGLTFKENCPDLRNSKVAEVVRELEEYGCVVSVHDPLASNEEARHEYGIQLSKWDDLPEDADAMVLAVGHKQYIDRPIKELLSGLKPGGVVIDVKSALDRQAVVDGGHALWRL